MDIEEFAFPLIETWKSKVPLEWDKTQKGTNTSKVDSKLFVRNSSEIEKSGNLVN